MKKESIALVSLGCAKNAVDLQVMAGNLIKKGCVFSPNPDCADIVIVNTCSFLASAREEAESEILRALELKKLGRYGKVFVTGCYPERYPEAISRFPGVDLWQGVPKCWCEPKLPGLRLTGKAFSYLKIAEGCDHRCSYCAIPLIRGAYRSRPFRSIMREARALLSSGCREINIVAQDPMLWRDGKRDIVDLLGELDKLEGDFWLRVLYSYPSEITERYLDWLSSSKHAVRYVDVPVQHTVKEVLEKMNRGAAAKASINAAQMIRSRIEGVTLRTTILTGFPGETTARFNQLLDDIKKMRFDHLGAFAYSPEEGTVGRTLSGRPTAAEAQRRMKKVMSTQARIWAKKAEKMIGSEYKALVVSPGVARLESQAPDVDGVVYVDSQEVGEFINLRLVRRVGFDFEGEQI
ncbi:MAG: radical SAM protein [Kiritimatiellae bacterium]|nr:radical SAM protein [Kiritimatiellia bacterium]